MPPTAPTITGPWPPLIRQLQTGSPTAGADCAVATAVSLLAFASGNRIRPTEATPARVLILMLRQRMTRQEWWPATSLTNSEEALEDDMTRVEMARKHMSPIVAVKYLSGTWEQARAELQKGRMLALAIQYGDWNDHNPRQSGDRAFRRDHMVGVLGIEDGWVRDYDPTHDRRRKGVPKGPITVRFLDLMRSAAARDGVPDGRASFLSVRRSTLED